MIAAIVRCSSPSIGRSTPSGSKPVTVTADGGYAYGKVYGDLEERGIDPVIPAKAEPIRSAVPLRRFRYDAKHDILRCPRGKILRPGRPIEHGRFFSSKARDCSRCSLASLCLSKGRTNKAVVISDDYPALLRARRRRICWAEHENWLEATRYLNMDHLREHKKEALRALAA
jgi:hypothetical protein